MAIAVVNTTTAHNGSTLTLQITKPTGLAVGHVMVALITKNNESVSGPSGWTSIMAIDNGTNFGDAWFYKVANSTDVAATNFTFTKSGSSSPMVGTIVALSGVDNASPIGGNASDNMSNGTTTTVNTPDYTDTITAGISFYSRSLRTQASGGNPGTISSVTSSADGSTVTGLSNHGVQGTTPAYSHGVFISNTQFSSGTHTPAHIGITSSVTASPPNGLTHNVSSAFSVKADTNVSVTADVATAVSATAYQASVTTQYVDVATASAAALDAGVTMVFGVAVANSTATTALDASRPVFADIASTVTASALDASRPIFADLANADVAAYDGSRPVYSDVATVGAVSAYDASVHFDVNPETAEVTAASYNSFVFRGSAIVRVLQVPPENRTFIVRR